MATRGPLLIDERPDDARMLRRTRLRLMAVSGFVTLLILLVLGGLTYTLVATALRSSSIDALKARAGVATETEDEPGSFALGGAGAGTFVIYVDPSTGQPMLTPSSLRVPAGLPNAASVAAAKQDPNATPDIREVTTPDGTPFRVLSASGFLRVRIPGTGTVTSPAIIQVVQPRASELHLLNTLLQVLLIGGLLALLAALAAGYLYAGRALIPIRDAIERRRVALQRQREFTANASHELRTPLTVIRASVEDLRRNRRARVEDVGEALEDIDAEVNHLTALVEDLLLLARTDSGVVQLERRSVDLADSAAEAVSLLAPLAHKQGVSVVLDPLPTPIDGDPLRLRQLVTILVDNAIRHSPRDSQVGVWVREESGEALLRVDDQGPGIRPEDMPRIFERFWRADNAPAGGTGLGLSIAHWIVDQHGGSITVANREEGGARFEVHLPVAPASADEIEAFDESEDWLADVHDGSATADALDPPSMEAIGRHATGRDAIELDDEAIRDESGTRGR